VWGELAAYTSETRTPKDRKIIAGRDYLGGMKGETFRYEMKERYLRVEKHRTKLEARHTVWKSFIIVMLEIVDHRRSKPTVVDQKSRW
jgi:hypothetical protein